LQKAGLTTQVLEPKPGDRLTVPLKIPSPI
jgi:hypothetical protein